MRRHWLAAIKQAGKGGSRPRSYGRKYAALQDLGEPQQGDRPSAVRLGDRNRPRRGGHKHPLSAHRRRCQVCTDVGDRYLFPTDELGGSRQLVFTADRARVAAKEVEVNKSRVVRAVRPHVQCQQGENAQGEGRAGREVGIPDVSKDLAGDRLVMTSATIKEE